MRLVVLSLFAALTMANLPQSTLAAAQPPAPSPSPYFDSNPEETAYAAFSAPYGMLLVDEFAAILHDSADANCLAAKGIQKTALAASARAILVRMSAQMSKKVADLVDREVFKAKLAALEGPDAYDELARLANDPDVLAYVELGRPAGLAAAANIVAEYVDRYLLLQRIKLKRPLNPLETGNVAIVDADPTDEIHDQLEEFMDGKKSAALARYLDLLDAGEKAKKQSVSLEVALSVGPVTLMAGLDKELREVCVGRP